MTTISRRTILGGIASTAVRLPAPAAIVEQPPMTPEERLQAAINDLKAAAGAVYPDLSTWEIYLGRSRDCPFLIVGY